MNTRARLTIALLLNGPLVLHIAVGVVSASKERQQQQKKRDKEDGITREVRKIIKPVKDHHDDCGEDLSRINPDLESELPHLVNSSSDSSDNNTEYFHLYVSHIGEALHCL